MKMRVPRKEGSCEPVSPLHLWNYHTLCMLSTVSLNQMHIRSVVFCRKGIAHFVEDFETTLVWLVLFHWLPPVCDGLAPLHLDLYTYQEFLDKWFEDILSWCCLISL